MFYSLIFSLILLIILSRFARIPGNKFRFKINVLANNTKKNANVISSKIQNVASNVHTQISARAEELKHLARAHRDGNSSEGIQPDPQKAVHYFNLAIQHGWKAGIYELAKLYHHGMHQLQPQLKKAAVLYKRAFAIVNDNQILDQIKRGLEQLRTEYYKSKTYKFLNSESSAFAQENPDVKIFNTPKSNKQLNLGTIAIVNAPAGTGTGVKQSIRAAIQKMRDVKPLEETLREIRELILTNGHTHHQSAALAALREIENEYKPSISMGLREIEILNHIWKHLNQSPDQMSMYATPQVMSIGKHLD